MSGTTSNRAYRYPTSTDAPNIPSDMQNLASDIDTDVQGLYSIVSTQTATTYTPTISNGGSATFTTRTGWYFQFGNIVFFSAYFAVNVGGSGSSNVTITSPTNPDRTTRQVVPGVRETSGRSEGVMVAFTGGSGAVWDRLVHGATDIIGSALTAGAIHIYTGFYRTA